LASSATARGLARGRALRGLSTEGAKAAGFPEGTAEIRAGGAADLVIWSGSPLDLRAKPLAILLAGKRARLESDR
jgi:imidazolonepropionase-like amidohydrolase